MRSRHVHDEKNSAEVAGLLNRPEISYNVSSNRPQKIKYHMECDQNNCQSLYPGYKNEPLRVNRPGKARKKKAPSFLYDLAHNLKAAALDKKVAEFPRTVIFCQSPPQIDNMWDYLASVLANERPEVRNPREYVQKYDAETSADLKKDQLASLKNPDSNLRIVVATSAFGMGVDVPNFRICVHWGVPRSFQCFVQESGRICRDGKAGVSFLIYNHGDLKGISPEGEDT